MPKLKRQATNPKTSNTNNTSLKDFLDLYPAVQLRGALLSFEDSTGWELMKAYISTVQRRYEVDALDLIGKGEHSPAAYASGYSKALEDLKSGFVEGLHQTILGKSQVIEDPRPEE
jgi:hypothetical protein